MTDVRVLREVEACMFGTDNTGICLSCGDDRDGCEPDAREYKCYTCGAMRVFGVEEILAGGFYHTTPGSA